MFRGLPASKASAASRSRNTNLFTDETKKKNPLFASNTRDSLFQDDVEDMDFGGYQPSLLGASNSRTASKSTLQAEENNTWKVKDTPNRKTSTLDDIFGKDSKQTTTKQPSIFDDEDDDIFGGGIASKRGGDEKFGSKPFSWDDNSKSTSDKILPLRPRADNSTIHNKPTVRAVDDFDDDLEEVML